MSALGKLQCSIRSRRWRPLWGVLNVGLSGEAKTDAAPPHGGCEPILTIAALCTNGSYRELCTHLHRSRLRPV